MLPQLPDPIGTKTCLYNQKIWIIKTHSFMYRALFIEHTSLTKYPNRAVIPDNQVFG